MRVVVDTATAPSGPTPARRHAAVAPRPGHNYLPYRYAIDGVITVGSQVPLRELEYFRAQWLGNATLGRSARSGEYGLLGGLATMMIGGSGADRRPMTSDESCDARRAIHI